MTSASLNRLINTARENSGIAPDPAVVAKLMPQGGNVSTRGDTHYAPTFNFHEVHDGAQAKRLIELHFRSIIDDHESEQRGP